MGSGDGRRLPNHGCVPQNFKIKDRFGGLFDDFQAARDFLVQFLNFRKSVADGLDIQPPMHRHFSRAAAAAE